MSSLTVNASHKTKLLYDRYMRLILISCAFFMTIIIMTIIIFVSKQGLLTLKEVSLAEFLFSAKWDPTLGQYGALSFIMGSIYVTALAVIIGGPLGLASAIFMTKIAPPILRKLLRVTTKLYVAVPSIVFGFIGLTIVVPFLRERFMADSGFGLLASALILSIMILPTIISLSEDAILAVPAFLEEGSLALGATRWQTIQKVIVPSAMPGILSAIVLAMARAIGETMAVQMVIGNTPQLAKSLFTPTATLTSEIVIEMGNTPFDSTWGNSLFLMALLLLILSLGLILLVHRITARRLV